MCSLPPLPRRTFLQLSALAALSLPFTACAAWSSPQPQPTRRPEALPVNADEAVQRLIEGNQRYVANASIDLNQSASRRRDLASSQTPFATIFSCVDSRVPPELVFDRGLGDLFVIRTAGHVLDQAALGSLEFGVAELHIPVIMVLGHERCGAVKATIEATEHHTSAPADIQALVDGIRPAVEQAKGQAGDLLENAVTANIVLTVSRLKRTPILAEAIDKSGLKIIGARYDLDSGAVELTAA
jgi:carbonic anhydrase